MRKERRGARNFRAESRLWTRLPRRRTGRGRRLRNHCVPRWRRLRGKREPGSMNATQIIAGRFAGALLQLLYGVRYTDMCPFRAIRRDRLAELNLQEKTYGWNLEMQMRAARAGFRILELPVDHLRRSGGESKVSGNLWGTMKAASRILFTIGRVALERTGGTG